MFFRILNFSRKNTVQTIANELGPVKEGSELKYLTFDQLKDIANALKQKPAYKRKFMTAFNIDEA